IAGHHFGHVDDLIPCQELTGGSEITGKAGVRWEHAQHNIDVRFLAVGECREIGDISEPRIRTTRIDSHYIDEWWVCDLADPTLPPRRDLLPKLEWNVTHDIVDVVGRVETIAIRQVIRLWISDETGQFRMATCERFAVDGKKH